MVNKTQELSLITTYLDNKNDALKLMRSLIESKLAGVVNIFETHSYLEEQGALSEIQEWKMVSKTVPALAEKVFNYLKSSHPCETPYIVMQKAQTNSEYVDWLSKQVK